MLTPKDIRILLVDGRKIHAETLVRAFWEKGIELATVPDIRRAIRYCKRISPQIVLVAVSDTNHEMALRFLHRVRTLDPAASFLLLSSKPSIASVLQALKAGASDYITEPLQIPDLLEKIAKILSKKSVQKENETLSDLAALHAITLSFYSTHKSLPLLQFVLDRFMEIVKAESGMILFQQEGGGEQECAVSKGFPKILLKNTAEGFCRQLSHWVCQNRRPLLMANDVFFPEAEIPVPRSISGSFLCLPFSGGGQRSGTICLHRKAATGPFEPNDAQVADVLARQATVAYENAQNYDLLSRRIQNLREIQTFGESLMKLTDRNGIVDFVLSGLLRAFGADVTALLVPVKRRYDFYVSSLRKPATGFTDHLLEIITDQLQERVKIPRSKVRTIQRMGGESKQSFLEHRIGKNASYLVCPLWNQGNWIGAIYLGSTKKNAFDGNVRGQLSSIAHQTCVSLLNSRLYEEIKENHLRTIKALAIAVDAKDKYTRGHSENVMKYSLAIIEEMGILDPRISQDIQNAALLHDIGKIGIPGHILNKPGKLTADEFDHVMKNHVDVGAHIIQEIPFLNDLVPLVLHHHERYDGKGYPRQLKGDEIPVGARILAVADSFEAMTSNRPYRKALSRSEAVEQLVTHRGTQFDPFIVDTFVLVLKKKFPVQPGESPEDTMTENVIGKK